MKKYNVAMIKGVCNGVLCSVIINVWIIISFYFRFNRITLYIIGLPLGIFTYTLIKQKRIKYFFVACGISVLSYIVTEIALNNLGIINMFYFSAVGDEIRMTAGDGFGIMVIHMFNYLWIVTGAIIAFIFTVISQRKDNKNQSKPGNTDDFVWPYVR